MRKQSDREDAPKLEKFNFEKMKNVATSRDAAERKLAFIEYYERFQEFPSYLFDNEDGIDPMLQQTIDDLMSDAETPKAVRQGVESLVQRLTL